MCGRNFFFYSNSRQVASVSTLYCDIVYLLVVNKFFSLSLFLSGNPIGKRSIVMSVSVCLSVCVPVCLYVRNHIFITTSPIFTKNFVHVTYGRGSVLLWQRSDTLCMSGFVDDVKFAHKLRLLDVAAQLKRNAHAALGLAIKCAQ